MTDVQTKGQIMLKMKSRKVVYIYGNGFGMKCLRAITGVVRSMNGLIYAMPTFDLDNNYEEVTTKIRDLNPDLIYVVECHTILRKDLLDIAPVIGFHPTKLPQWRGGAPVFHIINRGDTETYLSMYYYDEEIDHGPIIAQNRISIESKETSVTLLNKLASYISEMTYKYLPEVLQGKLKATQQNHSLASYTEKRTQKDNILDLNQPAYKIDRFVRAVEAYGGAFLYGINGHKLYIDKVHLDG